MQSVIGLTTIPKWHMIVTWHHAFISNYVIESKSWRDPHSTAFVLSFPFCWWYKSLHSFSVVLCLLPTSCEKLQALQGWTIRYLKPVYDSKSISLWVRYAECGMPDFWCILSEIRYRCVPWALQKLFSFLVCSSRLYYGPNYLFK